MIYAPQIDEEMKADFIGYILDGMRPDTAAEELGTTATQFKRLRRKGGEHYDPDFAAAYHQAINSSEHRNGFLEWLRNLQVSKAAAGDTRMIEKLSLIHDPDWEPLRHANLKVDVDVAHRILPSIPRAVLDAAIAKKEAELEIEPVELKALPPPAA